MWTDIKRWAMAIVYDATGKEDKQQLTRKERIFYSLYMAIFFFGLGSFSIFIPSTYIALVWGVVCFTVGARKMYIFWHKKAQWDEENKDYNSDV